MGKQPFNELSLGRFIVGSVIFIIGLGTACLSLPCARLKPMALIDLIFTSTSATCVTGLFTIPLEHFTFFGKCIILALIQIGGLGLITLTLFIASLFLNLGMATSLMAGQLLEFRAWSRVKEFLMLIFGITIFAELIGTAVLYWQFGDILTPDGRFFTALFHAISAFCSAGISLFDNNVAVLKTYPISLITLSLLMLAGSIGFFVWHDVLTMMQKELQSLKGHLIHYRMSLHTKIVLYSTLVIITLGTLIILGMEYNATLATLDTGNKIINAFFMAISARGIGFTTVSIISLTLPVLFIFMLIFFIGASPGSTGSGIKNTTFVLFSETILSIMRDRESVEIDGRRIPHDQVYKAIAIVALASFWVFLSTFILLLSESALLANGQYGFFDILFEAVSAFATCGYSTGITAQCSPLGKVVLISSMIIGRVGSLTIVLATRYRREKVLYQYPEERIIIG